MPQYANTERWLPVPGYEGKYEVSDLGRVRSLPRRCAMKGGFTRSVPGKMLTQSSLTGGYLGVCLTKDGRSTTKSVHPLVLQAFVGPRPGKGREYDACHNNGDKEDNRLANLRWDTKKGNSRDRRAHGTMFQGESSPRTGLSDSQVVELRRRAANGEFIRELAAEAGLTRSGMRKVVSGETFSHLPVLPRPRHGNARLNVDDVYEIRQRADAGQPVRSIADAIGVSVRTVYRVIRRESWTHV